MNTPDHSHLQRAGTLSLCIVVGAALAWIAACGDEARPIVAPTATAFVVAIASLVTLWTRQGVLPIYDVGAVFIFAVLLYTVVPLLGYLSAGLLFSLLSDARLVAQNPTPNEIAALAWRYVLFLLAFAITYTTFRTRLLPSSEPLDHPGKATTVAVVFWLFVFLGYLVSLWAVTGFSFYSSYDDLKGTAELYSSLPLVVQQLTHNVAAIFLLFKLALLVLLYARWEQRSYRWIVAVWIVLEIAFSVIVLGPRTYMLLFLVANVMLYHRFVRRLSPGMAVTLVVVLLSGVTVMGFVRQHLGTADDATRESILAASNEFQALFATGFDLLQRRLAGDLTVPWQVYFADIFRMIPQQLLPFEKIEHADWYLALIGEQGTGVGFGFGAIAESIVFGDWAGLAVRGAFLGAIFAIANNRYVRYQRNFYITLSYLWLCLYAYYSVRASIFYFVTWIEYRLLPTLALIMLSTYLLRMAMASQVDNDRGTRRRAALEQSPR